MTNALPTRIATVYVMFEEYDFLEQQIAALNAQDFRDFTFVCVSGHQSDEARIRATLAKAALPTRLLKRTSDNGPAGGFYDGEAWCLAEGFDVVVHIERDCFPTGPDLMRRLAEAIARAPVAVPVCMPDGIPMGWRFCAVRAEVLRAVGLSYRHLYFLTEDVYFYRNVTRRHRPEILTDVSVYHAPIIAKHTFTDKYLVAFPYLWARNHMLFPITLIKTHRSLRDVLNFLGYFVSVVIYGVHLAIRGKRRSAGHIARGVWDGLWFREDRLAKDRIEQTDPDYNVREVPSFDADLVLDKSRFDIGPGAVLSAIFGVRRRVLLRRTSQLVLLACLFVADTLVITDGARYWILKEHPREGVAALALFYVTLVVSTLLAVPALAFGLAASLRSHATSVPTVPPLTGAAATPGR